MVLGLFHVICTLYCLKLTYDVLILLSFFFNWPKTGQPYWRVAQRRNNYDFCENEIFTSNWPGDKGASFGTIKFSKNLLIKYIISIFNLNAFMRELGKKICSFERPLPLFFFSKQKLVWLLKEALNVRRENSIHVALMLLWET